MDAGVAIPAGVELAEPRPQPTALLAAAMAGEREAAQALALELIPRIRNLVRYLTRSSDIDDVAQEALFRVLQKLPSYRPTGSFHAWVDRVVVRVTYTELRRARRDARHEPIEVEEIAAADFADLFATRARIVAALDALSVEQRFAVVLHHVLGMSVPEIADELHAPVETIRSRLRAGMQHLRSAMAPSDEGDPR
ncbi:MAG: polymerase sigma-70 factor [Labilithrix sp.]|nr:polymerase sigma-70 factor [Labilithrix sp.]